MINNNEYEEKQIALFEYQKLTKNLYREKRKKRLKVLLVIIIMGIMFKIFFGTLEFNNFFEYSSSKGRYYKITVNEKQIPASYSLRHKIPIIPFLINFNSYYIGSSDIEGYNNDNFFSFNTSEKYIIGIESFNCYYYDLMIECKNNNQKMKKNNDTRYTSLIITTATKPYERVYEGKFIEDITPYVEKKGKYHIEITAKYRFFNEAKIYFYFNH